MCTNCGCDATTGAVAEATVSGPGLRVGLPTLGLLAPVPPRSRSRSRSRLLAGNAVGAEQNRAWLVARGIVALNLMGAPGAGKTSLLERTIRGLGDVRQAVIEGDQATERDAERIRAAGGRAVQVNTGAGCHLDAEMVRHAIDVLGPRPGSVLFVENVGNLVCPALFDLGESARVVLMSVAEGDDKPSKYPDMFRAADVVLLTKIDLAPFCRFDRDAVRAAIRELNPAAPVLELSARTGEGLDGWLGWILARRAERR